MNHHHTIRRVMSTTSEDPGHGHSPAAWTAVVIMLVAFVFGTVMFWFDLPWGVLAAAVLLVVGLIVGWVMGKLGYGVNGPKYQPKEH
jgi:protein-S-isoprenylcysteine O-methyltransferase Ste14